MTTIWVRAGLVALLAATMASVGCARHLGYRGGLEGADGPAERLDRYEVLRMRIEHADDSVSNARRNQLGYEVARAVSRWTTFEQVVPHAKSKGWADRAPVLELVVRRYEVPVAEGGTEVGLRTTGRLLSPDDRVLGTFDLEASSDYDWSRFAGVPMTVPPKDRFRLIARRTGKLVATYLNGPQPIW